jgi:hypothetical protein
MYENVGHPGGTPAEVAVATTVAKLSKIDRYWLNLARSDETLDVPRVDTGHPNV